MADTLVISPESGLKSFENYRIVYTAENKHILSYERFHADMQLCSIDNNVIVPPCFYDYYKKSLKNKNVLKGTSLPYGHYPKSAAYNVAVTDKFAICNKSISDRTVLDKLNDSGREIIDVKQGYAKCSVCSFGSGIITADRGIYKAVCGKMPALLINPGFVSLPGCEYGFLGGASGFDGRLIFSGNIAAHPDFARIDAFLKAEKIEYICMPGQLRDYGTLIFL